MGFMHQDQRTHFSLFLLKQYFAQFRQFFLWFQFFCSLWTIFYIKDVHKHSIVHEADSENNFRRLCMRTWFHYGENLTTCSNISLFLPNKTTSLTRSHPLVWVQLSSRWTYSWARSLIQIEFGSHRDVKILWDLSNLNMQKISL